MSNQPTTFSVSSQDTRGRQPIPIRLEGWYASGQVPAGSDGRWQLDLVAHGVVPLAAIATLSEAIIEDEASGQRGYNPAQVISFLSGALLPDSAIEFQRLVRDGSRLVDIADLAKVMLWLAEQYTGRPTPAPSSSSDGGAQSGVGAAPASPYPAAPVFPPPPQ
jgi:hypothetical protein